MAYPAAQNKLLRAFLSLLITVFLHIGTGHAATPWTTLEPGLELGEFYGKTPSLFNSGKITILRVNPKLWDIRLYTRHEFDYGKTFQPKNGANSMI